MNIIPWRKQDEVSTFRGEFDDLFNRFFDDKGGSRLPATFQGASIPPINVAETDKNWSVSFELPGLNEKDIQVQLMGNQLVVSGERKWEEEKKGKEFYRVESQYGAFQRAVELPDNARLQPDALNATYKRGILEVTIPKSEPTPIAKIPVKAG
jgi:HSP20 family protein